jgi:hypothetical protein
LSQDPQVGSLEIFEIKTFGILEGHNFFWKPPIEVRFKTKMYPYRKLSNNM